MSWIRQYIVVFASGTASMFLGASLVHNIFEPDMTLPKINKKLSTYFYFANKMQVIINCEKDLKGVVKHDGLHTTLPQFMDNMHKFTKSSNKSAGKVAHITRNIMIHCKSIGMVMRRSNE